VACATPDTRTKILVRARVLAFPNHLHMHPFLAPGVEAQAFMSCHESQARTCVLVGINGNVVAALAIADPLKPEARAVVQALHAQVGCCWWWWVEAHMVCGVP
jgi:cation transport ATPase